MNCPNCNTWNPDDKTVCWRCQTELPRPKPKKKKSQTGFTTWMWVLIVALFAITVLAQCYFLPIGAPGR